MKQKVYTVRGTVWPYPGLAAWHFFTLPEKESAEIKAAFAHLRRGWGSLPVTATVGKTKWQTSIFPDKRVGGYLLPIKAEVRKREAIAGGDTITVSLSVRT